jgi:hypothetical protein
MATNPVFAATPRNGVGQVSTANTNRDGTGTLATIFTAGSSGSRIDVIAVKATVTTTAGMVRLYVHDGSNARLWREVPVSAVTPSASLASFASYLNLSFDPLILPNGYSLRASTHNAETFNVIAMGGDF